uniref:BCAS3 domain-containing protein n=1 Tax=Kalanchoe fedtschenkoi TaxID=63787 RepID=A0A7N0SYB6_KALFE
MRKSKGRNNGGLFPSSLKIISSCIRTVSTNASTVASTVRSAGASVAASIAAAADDHKDQVTWAGFDKLELDSSSSKNVLLLGYQNGFQVLDVEDASNVNELVSKRDCAVTFLQMLPLPDMSSGEEGFRESHPLLLVVAGDEANNSSVASNQAMNMGRDGSLEPLSGNSTNSSTTVRFYSLRSHSYVHVLRFRSAVCMVRCSRRIVAVGLPSQIYCFDALTLVNKFSVLTYPVPQLGGQGAAAINIGYGPMAVGPRWLAYASSSPLSSNSGRLSPQYLTSSPGASLSTSPSNSTLVARYAVESSKQLAAGIINLGDKGYKTLSKYYQDFYPDGSNSPVSSNTGWKNGWQSTSETDNAGVVVVKDFVTREVISQFKAHSSPISAICFDPSGTLLVTASVYGNNINIFRIMPNVTQGNSSSQNYDWRSSHVHLYKLHRGLRSAVIQDICFSRYSQWVAIISSKGTCHIFFLSPFGGDAKFQTIQSESEEPTLFPVMPIPWWSVSSCSKNQPSFPAPSPVSLAVVTRLRNSDSGWLGTVGNAAAFSTGKGSVPSGAVAAVFHNSVPYSPQHVNSKYNTLEHLLVYTPSGHVVQHKLVPFIGPEANDGGSRIQPDSMEHSKYDELRVKVEAVQWWDVCRRTDWQEREECILLPKISKQDASAVDQDKDVLSSDFEGIEEKNSGTTGIIKAHDRSHIYLAKAEVQRNFGSFSWQESKVSFHMMTLSKVDENIEGEIEIEKLPVNEVEIRRKDPLPVFEHYHGTKLSWNDRGLSGDRYTSFSETTRSKGIISEGKVTEEIVINHSNPASLSSTESSDGGSSRRVENLSDLDQLPYEKPYAQMSHALDEFSYERRGGSTAEPLIPDDNFGEFKSQEPNNIRNYGDNCLSGTDCNLLSLEETVGNSNTISSESGCPSNHFNADPFTDPREADEKAHLASKTPTELSQCFQEEYCKASDAAGSSHKPNIANDDVKSGSSNLERENRNEGDNDDSQDMFGGMSAFFEEDS